MKTHKTKTAVISAVLICTLIISTTTVSFASTSEVMLRKDNLTESEIQKEIVQEQEKVMKSVYEQLEAQGRLDFLEDYEEILLPEIEYKVKSKYSCTTDISSREATTKYTYWYGGTIANTTVSGKNALTTYLDRDNSYYYILDTFSYCVSPIVEAILGSLPEVGAAFTILFTLRTIATANLCNEIKEAGGYTKTLTLRHPVTRDYSSVLLAWDTYPTATTYAVDTSKEIYAKKFPKYDPFDK